MSALMNVIVRLGPAVMFFLAGYQAERVWGRDAAGLLVCLLFCFDIIAWAASERIAEAIRSLKDYRR